MVKTESWLDEITKEYGSLEKYIQYWERISADPLLYGYSSFNYLLGKGLLKEDDIIRTNLEGGVRDGHYQITSKGTLEGVEATGGMYSGDSGVHSPEKILSLEKADNGWTLGTFAKRRIIRSLENI